MTDAFPKVTADMIDGDDEPAPDPGVGALFDLRLLDAMCQATGRDTLEYVRELLAVMHGERDPD